MTYVSEDNIDSCYRHSLKSLRMLIDMLIVPDRHRQNCVKEFIDAMTSLRGPVLVFFAINISSVAINVRAAFVS